ncbi:MAG TPA: EamA family transporter [Candidatus Binatia bacterium]|nr:EamA family transporter [Candidatus Binatia bacterium]
MGSDQDSRSTAEPRAIQRARGPSTWARRDDPFALVAPELLIVGGALSVQVSAGLAAQLIAVHGSLAVVAMRTLFSAAILLALRRGLPLPPPGLADRRRAILGAVGLGLSLAAMNTAFYTALGRIPLGVAVTIEFTGPLAVAVLGRRRALDLAWVVLAAAGIWILAGGRVVAGDALGVVAAFVAGACWAAYILVGGQVARAWPGGDALTAALLVSSALVGPLAVAVGGFVDAVARPDVALAGVVVAVFASAVPYRLEIAALGRMAASTFGVLMSLEPAIAAVVGFVVLGQVLSGPELAAIGAVAAACAGASWSARRVEPAPGELEAG